jgi:hypothetical protein
MYIVQQALTFAQLEASLLELATRSPLLQVGARRCSCRSV